MLLHLLIYFKSVDSLLYILPPGCRYVTNSAQLKHPVMVSTIPAPSTLLPVLTPEHDSFAQASEDVEIVKRDVKTREVCVNLEEVVRKLVASHVHRAFVVDAQQRPIGVVSLCDIIAAVVSEPPGYFGDFFEVNTSQYRT